MEIQIKFFSQQIRNLREEHNWTQEELAHQLGISRQSVIAFERGRCLPSLPLALSLADIFDLALENIFLPKIEPRKEIKPMTRDLMPWSPMRELSSLHESIDRLFEENVPNLPSQNNLPTINVYEKGGKVIVEADVPGVKEEDLSIEVGENHLTLSGERKTTQEIKEKDYYRREASFGSFQRTIPLPTEVDKNKAEAELKDGTLMIILPKKAKTSPKVTKIKVKKS